MCVEDPFSQIRSHISLPARCTDNKNLEKMIPFIVLDSGGQDSLFESGRATMTSQFQYLCNIYGNVAQLLDSSCMVSCQMNCPQVDELL